MSQDNSETDPLEAGGEAEERGEYSKALEYYQAGVDSIEYLGHEPILVQLYTAIGRL